jgi:AcrR family transcriptional regulator
MGRWQPDARGRLAHAAMELYTEKGFEATTVAEIAERAGLTERTFFRYFADKREVLFGGSHLLQDALISALGATNPAEAPIEQVMTAIEAADRFFTDRDYSRQRQTIINGRAELRERELIKLASLGAAFTAALRQRGVQEPAATLTAEAGVAVFKVAFERWLDEDNMQDFADLVNDSCAELKTVAAGAQAPRAKGAGRRWPATRQRR